MVSFLDGIGCGGCQNLNCAKMGWTDQHVRYLMCLWSPDVLNYSEMVTTGALLYGDRARYLQRYGPEGAVI